MANDYREALYECWSRDEPSFRATAEEMLRLTGEFLGVDHGHVSRVDAAADIETVVAATNDDIASVGVKLDHTTSFCRRTVEADRPIALSNAPEQGWADDPAYEEHGLRCYIGSPLIVNGEAYGTVCFGAESARGDPFDPEDRFAIELLARLLERDLESERHATALARSEKKYESLVTTAPDAIVLLDADDLTVQDANEAATELTGHAPESLLGDHVATLFPADRETVEESLAQFWTAESDTLSRLPDGTPLVIETQGGERCPVEVSASGVELDGTQYVQGIVRDISNRRERQRRLRMQTRAMDEAAVGITIADARSPDNEIVYLNDRFVEITGYDAEEIVGENCRLLQGPETDPDDAAALGAAIEAEEPVVREIRNHRADGTPFWNRVTVTPVENDDGVVTHYVGFQQDVTERKRRERLLDGMDRVLRHNLRNDMNTIMGLAGVLADRAEAGSEEADFAETIRSTADGLHSVSETARTLKTVSVDADQRRLSIAGVVEEALDGVRAPADATVTVDVEDAVHATVVEQLSLGVRELVENALQHAGPGATVSVRIRASDAGPQVVVADDGPGLADGDARLLTAGEETPLKHGSGLGLWLVRWVVTASDGHIHVAAEDGTTVTLTFPGE